MEKAGISVYQNFWSHIYNFNPDSATWSLLPPGCTSLAAMSPLPEFPELQGVAEKLSGGGGGGGGGSGGGGAEGEGAGASAEGADAAGAAAAGAAAAGGTTTTTTTTTSYAQPPHSVRTWGERPPVDTSGDGCLIMISVGRSRLTLGSHS